MKKIFGLLALAILAISTVSCGSDEPKPVPPLNGIYSALSDGSSDYETTTEKYYRFFLNPDGTASDNSIYIHNAKFDEKMPLTINMRIPVDPKQVTRTTNGFTVTVNEIVPYMLSGGTEIPMEKFKITNLALTVNTTDKLFSIRFTCYGLDVNESGKLNM
ncbi:MAG: hypothetical protein HUK11_07305 [Muribaculaceae bacterium]|nr:hypothetical protein [Muribaculaceae bacterium]